MHRPALALVLMASAANAQTPELISADDPEGLVAYLEAEGYSAEILSGVDGNPRILTEARGLRFNIFLRLCVDHANCQAMQFDTSFHLSAPLPLEQLNEWNGKQMMGLAAVTDDNWALLSHPLITTGGLPEPIFAATLGWWMYQMEEYGRYIGYITEDEAGQASSSASQ
ncbi:YbjN domain-containing protein [Pseudoroseicyclus sp. CXY001]|uniref:YbjN domain-containing protein n=1 Tax=Pseudoroseicyclus sp. CXY001 TaxID=3242492 RepID=UPI0035714731